jgi:hypothetical protein
MLDAATECSRSSVRSKFAPGIHGRWENAAAVVINAPKAPCRLAAHGPQRRRQVNARKITDSPNRTNPRRATHAPRTPWAADSLVVWDTHE